MRNFYSLNPGEFFVAQELKKHRPDLQLYFPLKDTGIDLLAVDPKNAKVRSIQVKESRQYPEGSAWHQVRTAKLSGADVFVFVSYVPIGHAGTVKFENDYAVIPREDLKRLCQTKRSSGGKYSFYLKRAGDQLLDVRDGRKDLSPFAKAWQLI